ncbi:phenylalanine--tRNA ligase subunit beta [Lichenihabitans sp. Uapishka_5]|uniref:phenylalanine--tRNA ligase subunit beta n=1 Tax=Lichenihabitans sp. Uapishka_5 TaxID=3037302 RepID=UPI0029E7D83B|nr:phenylalanine--tRNA ligase subunit beta [Lichenihabitans sp. Uapishka_5]MDX7949838.1 phenylalanine--tRNA ligase subunit beta [Lichenihabitans sp. Uapishka_5]
MKFTLSWLKDHLDTTASLDVIVETLTRIGLEVEHLDNPGERLKSFTVARVLAAVQHPNADRLRVCTVDTGQGAPLQVVCGAPNARAGMVSVFSPPGTFIPGKNITIAEGVIRGVESKGMLCSEAELDLSTEHDGIIDLPSDAPVGVSYAAYAGLDDPLIEINLTPNRPDAASVYGIARDLAAAGLGTLRPRASSHVDAQGTAGVAVRLDLVGDDAALAPAFALRRVRGVRNGPSPDWLKRRLSAIGLRPINALVDVTNYLTFDQGRPLHVFDAAKVTGDLAVRRARPGETLVALDGRSYALDADVLVIADDKGPESIAGIMGGEASGCDAATTEVLVESALWEPLQVARTGRKLGLNTDARYRFERGVDPAFCLSGLDRATALIVELCGGEPSEAVVAGTVPTPDHRILFPWSEVRRLTGLALPQAEMAASLERLGFELLSHEDDSALVRVPSWRPDVHGKADLVEEIVRLAGLDQVVPEPLRRAEATVPTPVLTLLQKRTRLAKRSLSACGLLEAVTWSFVSHERAIAFGGGQDDLALANPIAADLSDMRPSLLPGLLAAAERNAKRGQGDVALFEVGQVFRGAGEGDQRIAVAGIRRGTARVSGAGRRWGETPAAVSVFDTKADVLTLLASLGIATGGLQVVAGGPAYLHPGRSGTLQFGPKAPIGSFGEIHPKVLDGFGGTGPVVGFEIILDALPAPKQKPTRAKGRLDVSELMPLDRDFAFVVDRGVAAADILKAIQAAERTLLAGTTVFDVYEGPGVPEGKKSVAVTATLQPRDKTLTEADLEAFTRRVVEEVGRKTGAVLRS